MEHGCVQVYTGNGKGKTTAAVGLAVRAAGAGLHVYFGQFMKNNETGELHTRAAGGCRAGAHGTRRERRGARRRRPGD